MFLNTGIELYGWWWCSMKTQDCTRNCPFCVNNPHTNLKPVSISIYRDFPSGSRSTPGFPCPTHDRGKPPPSDRRTKNTEAPTFEKPISLLGQRKHRIYRWINLRSFHLQRVFFTWNPRVIPAFPLWINSFDSEPTLAYKDYIVTLLYKRRQNHRKTALKKYPSRSWYFFLIYLL